MNHDDGEIVVLDKYVETLHPCSKCHYMLEILTSEEKLISKQILMLGSLLKLY